MSRNGFRWSVNECLQLEREVDPQGLCLSFAEIAERHQRTPKAIAYKAVTEELVDKNDVNWFRYERKHASDYVTERKKDNVRSRLVTEFVVSSEGTEIPVSTLLRLKREGKLIDFLSQYDYETPTSTSSSDSDTPPTKGKVNKTISICESPTTKSEGDTPFSPPKAPSKLYGLMKQYNRRQRNLEKRLDEEFN